MRTRSVVGVVVGGIADILATNLLAFPFLIYVMVTRDLSGVPRTEIGTAALAAILASPVLQITGWALGLTATVLGGYLAARIARRAEVVHGALSAWLCMGLGVYSMFAGDHTAPLWQHVLAFVLSPVFGAFGGYLRRSGATGDSELTPMAAVG